MKRNYPVGIQNFEKIRSGNYCYIDKTELIYKLVKSGQYYFLSRPRRFGKSLLISTIETYFQGKKELFEGLAMETLETEWTEYPILHLDLNAQKYDTPESLYSILNDALCAWEAMYETRPSETTLSLRFQGVIQRAAEKWGRNVVILVDEYDKPMLQAIGNEALLTDYRNTLKAFYGVSVADRLPQHAESLLRRDEELRPLHQVCPTDRSNQVQQGERVQRSEQSDGHLYRRTICQSVRHYRRRTVHQLPGGHHRTGAREQTDRRGNQG